MTINNRHIKHEDRPDSGPRADRNAFSMLPFTATASLPSAATGNEGGIVYDSTTNTVKFSDGSSWAAIAGSSINADAVYNVAAWTVAVDANDVLWNLADSSNDYDFEIRHSVTGTLASALVVDAYHATSTITDAIVVKTTGATAVVTDALDMSDAGIVNALNVGANSIVGTTPAVTLTNFSIDASGNVICVNLTASGTVTMGAFEVAGALTCDELILDTDGAALAATVCYAVRDNSGDFTVNAVTGKMFNVAIAGADEYNFSATDVDLLGNHLDNAGYLVMNAVTLPAGTEVYAGHDNSGDLTVNCKTGKTINFAVAGADEISIGANVLNITAGSDIKFGDDGGLLDSSGNEVLMVEATGSAVNYLQVKNAATANPISLACMGTVDKGFLFENDQDEVICAMTPVATGVMYMDLISSAAGSPIIKIQGGADKGLLVHNAAGEPTFEVSCGGTAAVNWVNCIAGDTGVQAILQNDGEDDVGFLFNAKNGEEILSLKTVAASVDYVEITGSAADGSPTIKSNGSDTHIDLILGVKGTANVIVDQCGIAGGDGANENFVVNSTTNATKGWISIPNGEQGLNIGGVADRATAGDNVLSIIDGAAAPVGVLANGISLYSEGGECKVLDAAGNSTTLSSHSPDSDFIIRSYAPAKDETILIHLEKLAKALVDSHPELSQFVEVLKGDKN